MGFQRKTVQKATAKLALGLARRIGEHKVIDDADLLAAVAGDESHCAPSAPDLLVRARDASDVVALLKEAQRHGVPVTPRGGGTGKAGGAIPIFGGVVLDTSRMKQLIDIDAPNLMAVVEPGMITGEFHQAVEQEGLFYPPDPNSLENCCLGGNVAHNAGGPRAFKYGVTREYVMGLDVVLMGGQQLPLGRRTIKSVAGYDPTGFFVGSEGTLGVFTSMRLRLVRKPPELATLLVRFSDEIAAGRAVSRIVERGLVPRVMEFMDGVLVEVIRKAGAGSIPAGTGALLLAEIDGKSEALVEADVEDFAEACEAEGAIDVLMARHGGEREKLWAARRVLSDAVKETAGHKIAEDIAVPRNAAAELLSRLRKLSQKHDVQIASYGHAGDGNFHVNLLWDDDDWDPEPAVVDIFRTAIDLGGTISGEHGIGLAKKKYLPLEKTTDQLAWHKRLKDLFDPQGLLNPGKIFESD